AERVAGQKENIVRMAAAAGRLDVVNELHRVRRPRVLSVLLAAVIGSPRARIEDDVFQHGAETDGVPDLRLVRLRKIDALGVTAAFEIENALVGPAVLVVADEPALGVGA